MKFIGKAEEKKIELQIESLQKKVTELGSQLLKAQTDAAKTQTEAATALVAANQSLAEAKAQQAATAKAPTRDRSRSTFRESSHACPCSVGFPLNSIQSRNPTISART